jgi:hypothetical protein
MFRCDTRTFTSQLWKHQFRWVTPRSAIEIKTPKTRCGCINGLFQGNICWNLAIFLAAQQVFLQNVELDTAFACRATCALALSDQR